MGTNARHRILEIMYSTDNGTLIALLYDAQNEIASLKAQIKPQEERIQILEEIVEAAVHVAQLPKSIEGGDALRTLLRNAGYLSPLGDHE
jgi:hypothetical protein